jgi:hypothetical protein
MSEAELNQLRKRNIKKILITIFTVTGLAAIITIITILIMNIASDGGGG